MGKKLLSLLLALVMVVMVLPVTALAARATDMTFTIFADGEADVTDTVDVTVTMEIQGTANFQGSFCTISTSSDVNLTNGDGSELGTRIATISDTDMGFTWAGKATFAKAGQYTITATMVDANGSTIDTQSCSINVTEKISEQPGCPHKDTEWEHNEPKAAKCTEDGWNEYFYCPKCMLYKTNESDHWFNGTSPDYEKYIVLKAEHTFDDDHTFKACDPGCVTNGLNEDCKQCTVCEKWFSASHTEGMDNIHAIGALLIPATGHKLETVGARESTCGAPGCVEHQHCSVCGKDFAMDAGKYNMHPLEDKDVYLELADHSMIFCKENKYNYDFWYCENCGKYFKDAEGSEEFAEGEWIKEDGAITSKPDHILMKHVEKVDATCTEPGNIEYWVCLDEGCGRYFKAEKADATDEIAATSVVLKALNHANKVHVDDSATSKEHWYCPDCEKYFLDAGCTEEVTQEETGKGAVSHEHKLTHHGETATTKEYWYCEECEKYFLDEAGTVEVSQKETGKDVPSIGHTLNHHKASPANCTEGGNVEYWECTDEGCGLYFADESASQVLKATDVFLNPLGHSMKHHEKTATTRDYYYCERCHLFFEDEAGAVQLSEDQIQIPQGPVFHYMTYVPAEEPTCQKTGCIEHYFCEECGKYYADPNGVEELKGTDVLLNTVDHDWTWIDEVAATEDEDGCVKHAVCGWCGMVKTEKHPDAFVPGDHSDWLTIPATGPNGEKPGETDCKHTGLIFRPTKAATCTAEGWKAYYHCGDCGAYFDEAKQVTTWDALHLSALGHNLVYVAETDTTIGYWRCTRCGMKFSDAEGKNPITDIAKPENPQPPVDPTVPETKPVIKDDMGLSGMHMSTILGKGNEP